MSIAVENRDGRRRETDRSRCRVAVQWNGDNSVAGAREITPRAIVPTTHLRPRCYHSRIPGAYFAHAVPHAIRNVKGEKNSIQIVMTMLEHKQFDRTILRSV